MRFSRVSVSVRWSLGSASFVPAVLLGLVVVLGAPSIAAALTNQECLDCHTMDMAAMSAEDRAGMVNAVPGAAPATKDPKLLQIKPETYAKSVHGAFDCVNCHVDITEVPHAARLAPVNCKECHAEVQAAYDMGIHRKTLDAGNGKAATCASCHGSHDILPTADPASRTNKKNLPDTCGKCHLDDPAIAEHSVFGAGANPIESYKMGTHAKALARGMGAAATCNDCHESHALLPMSDPASSIFKMNVSKTCGKCHAEEAKTYDASVHGQALARGVFDSPTCNDCHGEHGIIAPTDPASPVSRAAVGRSACADCHRQERLSRRFGLASKRVTSYEDSFHGLANRMGDTTVANCASCHGVHNILPSSDPASTIHPDRLPTTCGSCHPRFTQAQAIGPVHGGDEDSTAAKANWWVRWFYYSIIVGTLGFMFAHNFLDWLRSVLEKMRDRKNKKLYVRLSRNERWMHLLLLTSFITLAVTGFMLVYNVSVPLVSGELSQKIRATGHRVAAVAFTAWAVWHVVYLVGSRRGRRWFIDMLPKLADARDFMALMKFNLGLSKVRPKFARFSYIEKLEYWALLWGAIVMMATGAALWFKNAFAPYLPFWGFDIATLIHLMEAILASAAIVIWHFYAVIFKSDVRPMAVWWITGTMTEEEMHEEHALELERLQREEKSKSKSNLKS